MKSISSYIKSKSIREYYEKNDIKLNMVQAAFIIWHNDEILYDEKIDCYKTIADTYDDMSVDTIENGDIYSIHIGSFKNYIYTMIDRLKNNYDKCIDNSNGAVYSIGYSFVMKDIHDTLEDAINHIKSNKSQYKEELDKNCIRIYKIKDKNNTSKYNSDYIELDSNLEIRKIDIYKIKSSVEDTNNIFHYIYIEMPHPFKRGDIVKDIYKHSTSYYCIDVMSYWDEKTLIANKINKNWVSIMDENYKRMVGYPECMDFGGYMMDKIEKEKFNGAEAIFCYDAGDNPVYIDLEFVEDSELKGYFQILKLCREYIRRIVNGEDQLTPLSIIGYYKEIEANAKGKPPVVYDKPEDAYYEQYYACPLTYL